MATQKVLLVSSRAAALLLCMASLCGCSLIGAGIGLAIDSSAPETDTLLVIAAGSLEQGDDIRVLAADSTLAEGVLTGFEQLDAVVYAGRYERFLKDKGGDTVLPSLDEQILFRTQKGDKKIPYLFRGFGVGTILVQANSTSQVVPISLSAIASLENRQGVVFDLGRLERMNNAGQIPRAESLVVKTEKDTLRIPVDEVLQIEKQNLKHTAVWVGAIAGLVVDVAAIIFFSNFRVGIGGGWSYGH